LYHDFIKTIKTAQYIDFGKPSGIWIPLADAISLAQKLQVNHIMEPLLGSIDIAMIVDESMKNAYREEKQIKTFDTAIHPSYAHPKRYFALAHMDSQHSITEETSQAAFLTNPVVPRIYYRNVKPIRPYVKADKTKAATEMQKILPPIVLNCSGVRFYSSKRA
jgi:hypothetical protein